MPSEFLRFGTIGRCRCGEIGRHRTFWRSRQTTSESTDLVEVRVNDKVVGIVVDTPSGRARARQLYSHSWGIPRLWLRLPPQRVTFAPAYAQAGSLSTDGGLPHKYNGHRSLFSGEPLCDVCVKTAKEFRSLDTREYGLIVGGGERRKAWLKEHAERETEVRNTARSHPAFRNLAPRPRPIVDRYPYMPYAAEAQLYSFGGDDENARRPEPEVAELVESEEAAAAESAGEATLTESEVALAKFKAA